MNIIEALKPLLSKTIVWKIDTLTFESVNKILMCYHSNKMALEDPLQSKCTIHFLGFFFLNLVLNFFSWNTRANSALCKSDKFPSKHYF